MSCPFNNSYIKSISSPVGAADAGSPHAITNLVMTTTQYKGGYSHVQDIHIEVHAQPARMVARPPPSPLGYTPSGEDTDRSGDFAKHELQYASDNSDQSRYPLNLPQKNLKLAAPRAPHEHKVKVTIDQ